MSEPVLSSTKRAYYMAAMPTDGPWFLAAAVIDGVETFIACAPDHPPIFFQNDKKVDLFARYDGGGIPQDFMMDK